MQEEAATVKLWIFGDLHIPSCKTWTWGGSSLQTITDVYRWLSWDCLRYVA